MKHVPASIQAPTYAIDGYEALIAAMVQRKRDLGLTNLEVDERGNLPSGYFSKLCCGSRIVHFTSLGKALAALDMVLIAIPKPSQQSPTLLPENAIPVMHLDTDGKDIRKKAWGRIGGRKWALLTAPRMRRARARKAGLASAAKRKAMAAERTSLPTCPVEGCGAEAVASGWCEAHYSRLHSVLSDGQARDLRRRPGSPSPAVEASLARE